MQKEKIALIALVIIVVAALSTFLIAINTDIFTNLFEGQKIIEIGDYADVHYIGYYASNGTHFTSSYKYPENKSGGTPAKIFVTYNTSATAGANFSGYTNTINGEYVHGFIQQLVGMTKGQTKRTAPISPQDAYGISPKVGDNINYSKYVEQNYGMDVNGKNLSLTILSINPNGIMPVEYRQYLGNVSTTTNFTIRDNVHYIGEFYNLYSSWKNSSVVTKINITKIWTYTTPPANLSKNFTWMESDATTGADTTFPKNCSTITNITNKTITITHTPQVNSTISQTSQLGQSTTYTVQKVTADKINASRLISGNKTYKEFDRHSIIQRNSTQNITYVFPGEILELQYLATLRGFDSNFHFSYLPLSDKTVYFDIYVLKVYKAS